MRVGGSLGMCRDRGVGVEGFQSLFLPQWGNRTLREPLEP